MLCKEWSTYGWEAAWHSCCEKNSLAKWRIGEENVLINWRNEHWLEKEQIQDENIRKTQKQVFIFACLYCISFVVKAHLYSITAI